MTIKIAPTSVPLTGWIFALESRGSRASMRRATRTDNRY
jgi:hypothetical protein